MSHLSKSIASALDSALDPNSPAKPRGRIDQSIAELQSALEKLSPGASAKLRLAGGPADKIAQLSQAIAQATSQSKLAVSVVQSPATATTSTTIKAAPTPAPTVAPPAKPAPFTEQEITDKMATSGLSRNLAKVALSIGRKLPRRK